MLIQVFPSGPIETNAYVIACPVTREAAIIDPAAGCSQPINAYIKKEQLVPKKILITHSHWDHIADTATLKKAYQIPVLIHQLDAYNLENPGADQLNSWVEIPPVIPEVLLKDQDQVRVGNMVFQVIHTPGHSPGCVCFYSAEEHVLFSGDTLFKGTIGKLTLPTARPQLMWDSLRKLAALPGNTVVYPGHGPSTTIAQEKWLSRAEEVFGR